jgi:tRNA-guanine family transglycosylase
VFDFHIDTSSGRARAGVFTTPHGDLLTPVFAPVGTLADVKMLTPAQVEAVGASLVLSNTYHLYLRPGDELVRDMGGLHEFMQWPRPMLTDSGGFQVFSLSKTRKIDDDGVTFKSHIDGSTHRFTPEKSVAIQENLGADIIMAFDECSDPNDRSYTAVAMRRTHLWAERSLRAKTRSDQALFGIIQGGVDPDAVHCLAGHTRHCHRRTLGGGEQGGDVFDAGCDRAASPCEQAALLDGRGHTRGPHRGDCPRRGHLRLRPAHTPRPPSRGLFPRGAVELDERGLCPRPAAY